ncbi:MULTISPECIES: hypothetical protein [unclassified Bradyrhizobium]|uniref:hypothetical protein n=1 Tax=unclassified Bradyrhizobium TaxID=2631580 RepID=UPI0028EFB44A|nr:MULTISPECIES: hypothetical protein [unclassified Bradyrhizobium]
MTDEIKTLEDFERACVAHDLTHGFADDGESWRRGCISEDRIRKAAENFSREDVERIWNAVVDTKLVPEARSQFYWRWPQEPAR